MRCMFDSNQSATAVLPYLGFQTGLLHLDVVQVFGESFLQKLQGHQ